MFDKEELQEHSKPSSLSSISNATTKREEQLHSVSNSFTDNTHLAGQQQHHVGYPGEKYLANQSQHQSHPSDILDTEAQATNPAEAGSASGPVPPDGGYGWVVVAACFLNNFAMLGYMFSWGVFQQEYTKNSFPGQVSAVSWIGTLAFGCMYMLGGVFSLFAAKIGYNRMVLTGSIFVSGGLVAASFATEIWHLYLSQGLMYGMGAAMANPCVLSAPATWFVARRGMASGMAIAGSGMGGLIFNVVIQKMIDGVGVRWCLRILAILLGVMMIVCGSFIRQFNSTGKKATHITRSDLEILKQPTFLLMVLGVMTTAFGYFAPLNLLPSFAVDKGLTSTQGAMLNSVLNAASFFGRFVGGIFGDRFGLINLCLLCVVASSLTTLVIWMLASSLPVMIVYSVSYGLLGGGFISLLGPILAEQFGTGSLTILVGIVFGVNGVGSLLGTPIAAALLSAFDNNYKAPIAFIGGIMMVGALVFFALKLKAGGKGRRNP
ncbi:hypothetical protein DFQ27_008803 [Actinomortierella ambigua]|uniref:Major facilitator superfamily (MFS) profile domain-containing protein n=1 Tax=Actinomortierella ambigua TaxID=1343610 RepID=A0A9P6UB37_9FUNG|nr:hypothetical protein DFQ27_008803 [Actinomortierella ambigua]